MNFVKKLKEAKNNGRLPNIEIEFVDDDNAIIGDFKIHYEILRQGLPAEDPEDINIVSRVGTNEKITLFSNAAGVLPYMHIGQCEHCGEIFEDRTEPYHSIEGDTLCDRCFNDLIDVGDIISCADCGYFMWRDNATWVEAINNHVCDACLENNYCYCDSCECWEPCDDTRTVIVFDANQVRCGTRVMCQSCLEDDDNVYFCDDCGEYFYDPTGNHCTDESGNYHYCYECRPTSLTSETDTGLKIYHEVNCYHPDIRLTPISHKNKIEKIDKFKGYGIELEVDKDSGWTSRDDEVSTLAKLNNIAGGHMYFSHDCSLRNGFEIVTQPHTESAMHKIDWKSYLKTLQDAGYKKQSSHAGYHIHISRLLFGNTVDKQNDNIAKLLYFFENNKDDLIKMSRRAPSQLNWCKFYSDNMTTIPKTFNSDGYANSYEKFNIKNKKHLKLLTDKTKRVLRYRGAVNLNNNNTVEIRLFRSTLDYNDFMATFDFITTLVNNINKISWKNINNMSKWLENAPETVTKYIKKKGVLGACA